jgi:hypothetical protein
MTEAANWESFYVMTGGAAAVLTGLIFVAITLHTRPIMDNVVHRERAWSSLATLLSLLVISMAILAPGQGMGLLGLEILVIAAIWVIRTVRIIARFGNAFGWLQCRVVRGLEWIGWIGWLILLVAGGLLLGAENDMGFGALALAMALAFGFAIWSSWVLISEIDG